MDISIIIAIIGAVFGTGGIGGTIAAYRKINLLKDRTVVELQQLKEQSFVTLINELTNQRQHETKEHDDCEAEKELLRDKYETRIQALKDEIELRGVRILSLKTIIVDNGIKIPDGM